MVDGDAQGLKQLGHILLLALAVEGGLHGSHELSRRGDGVLTAGLDQQRGDAAGIAQLTVEVEDVGQLLLGAVVDEVGRRGARAPVHAHVERSIEAEREATALVVEVVTRHAEVGQQAVDMVDAVVAHPVAQVAEIGPDEGEARVVDKAPCTVAVLLGLQDILLGVGILVEAVEVAVGAKAAQNLARVASATERDIHINTVGLDGKSVDALFQKHGYVVDCGCIHRLSITVIRGRSSFGLQ